MSMQRKHCTYCDCVINSTNVLGLNKKLFEVATRRGKYLCLHCMSETLDCTEEELQEKISDFKKQGCKLFS